MKGRAAAAVTFLLSSAMVCLVFFLSPRWLALPLAGEVSARDGSARAGAGECLVAEGLDSLDFSGAGVTLLTRAA